jgi:hypothetical protein
MMSEQQHPTDHLKEVWAQIGSKSSSEEHVTSLSLLREKQRSLHDFLHIASSNTYLLALSFVPLFVLLALRMRSIVLMGVGNFIIAVVLLFGALITWLFERRADSQLDELNVSALDYQSGVLRTIEENIRFSKGIKFWFAPFLFLGISLAAFPIMTHFLPVLISFGALFGCWICFEYYVWRLHDLKRVGELQRRKVEVESLIREMTIGD